MEDFNKTFARAAHVAGIAAAYITGGLLAALFILFTLFAYPFRGPVKKSRNILLVKILRLGISFYIKACLPIFGICSVRTQILSPIKICKTPQIYVANHRSMLDPFIIMACVPNLAVLLKRKYAKGIAGAYLSEFLDFSCIEKDSRESLQNATRWGERMLAGGRNILIFPEGSRSPTERMLPFNSLAFRLAKKFGAKIRPVAIHSDKPFMAKGIKPSIPRGNTHFEVEFLNPVSPEGLSADDMLISCERAIFKTLNKLRSNRNDG